jgi:large subunit ribosomal protein L7/L12
LSEQSRLNIADIPIAAAPAAAAAPAGAAPADAEAEKPKEKTVFNLSLVKIDPAQKAKVIKEVKSLMPNMNLVEVRLGFAWLSFVN